MSEMKKPEGGTGEWQQESRLSLNSLLLEPDISVFFLIPNQQQPLAPASQQYFFLTTNQRSHQPQPTEQSVNVPQQHTVPLHISQDLKMQCHR